MRNFFYSLVSLITGLFFTMLGIVTVLLPWSPKVLSQFISFIQDESKIVCIFGFSLFLVGVGVILNVLLHCRKHYYRLKCGSVEVRVDENVLQEYVNKYLKEIFPKKDVPSQLIIRRNRLHIVADLPYVPYAQQEIVLTRIRRDLEDRLEKFIGYKETFSLSASFQPAPKEK